MTTNGANGVLKRPVIDTTAPLKKPKLSSESEQDDEAHALTSNGHAEATSSNHVGEIHNGIVSGNHNDADVSNSSALDSKKHKKKKHKKEKKRKKDKHGGGDDDSATADGKIKKKHKKDKKHKKHKKKHRTKNGDAEGGDETNRAPDDSGTVAEGKVKSETPDELSQSLRDGSSSSLSPPKVSSSPLRTKREIMDDDDDVKEPFDGDASDDEDYGAASSSKNKKSSPVKKAASSSKKTAGKKTAPAGSSKSSSKTQKASSSQASNVSPTQQSKRNAKKEKEEAEQAQVWRWWEEAVGGKEDSTVKWAFLEHKGPVFAPPYDPLPADVRFSYDGKVMKLSNEAEEVATFYARMLDHDYTSKDVFNKNFFKDWRKVMTTNERETLKDLGKCNFAEIHTYFKKVSEERKAMSKEEKNKIKEENARMQAEYGFCKLDGYQQKIANFRIEPPGLFRGRGDHPKMGQLKRRVKPEDVIINCSKDAQVPKPPAGHKWQQVRHDNTVTWLCSWTDNIMNSSKYMMLNPSSKLKGQKDLQKYEKARQLHKKIDKIRETYRHDWKAKEMEVRQRATALYLIDKLALRAGNEKEEGEAADTVGCCSLRVEHIKLEMKPDGDDGGRDQFWVHFDFLGKDSIPYHNSVEIEKRVYKNLELFCENKKPGDDLFDRLDTSKLNKHLNSLMDGLTAKVFRTYNASITLQQELRRNTTAADDTVAKKLLAYNRANRSVAILCNHQRAVPKSFGKSMEGLQTKIDAKKELVKKAKKEFDAAKKEVKGSKNPNDKKKLELKQRQWERAKEQLEKLDLQATDREENKTIALGTSKLNYLDPRISVAWCKKFSVPIEKIYNKTQRDKFQWAIDMTDADFEF